MGIPRFAYFISNRYPLIIKKIREEYDVPEIDNLYLDINGIIHNASHNYYCDASKINETTKKIYLDVCEVIKGIVHLIKPKKLLMISADGVAPRAKMNQQRIRRFRKELESMKNQEGEEQKKINEDIAEEEKIIFDSNAISAGTKFMFNLTTYMKEYIINEKKTNKEWSNIEVILTGSDVPGEGEHKILEYIRNYKSSDKYHPYTKHCIYGLDADLIMLSLISHETNFIILREDTFKIRKKEKMEKKGIEVITVSKKFNNDNYIVNGTPYEFLLISVLREYLELEFGYLKNKIKFKYNLEKIIDDFIFLCFFIGNDFLPNLFSFNIENGALTHLFEFYKACLPELDGYLTEKGKINVDRMKIFFNYLSKHELHSIDMLLRKNKNENKKDRMKRANDTKEQIKLLKKQKIEEKKKKFYEDLKSKTKEEQNTFKKNKKEKNISALKKKFKEISDELKKEYVFKDEYEKLKNKNVNNESKTDDDINPKIEEILKEALKYDSYIEDENYCSDMKFEDIDDSDISDIDTKEVLAEFLKNNNKNTEEEKKEVEDDNDINIIFVEKMKKLKNAKEVKEFYYKEKLNIDLNTEVGKKEREKMFNLYLEGLQWILCYYYRGLKSWKWYYPYHYAPMISDYTEVNINESLYNMFDLFNNNKSEPFNPYQSLLLILPKQSFNLLPKCYRDIPSQIPEYFPEKIEIDYNGKTASYESLLLLPFVEEKKILELENKNKHLDPEEEKENKWGETFLFFKNELNTENISLKTYEIYQNKNVDLINNYEIRKCDFSFPTLKTLDYDYQLINVKQFFGKTSNITKQITITPRASQKINNMKIDSFLREKTIFIDYPYKRLAKIKGFVYKRFFYYLYGNIVYIDNNFRLSKELIESIRYSHQKIGIYLEHPETLCYVVKFNGYKSVKDKMIRQYDESNPYYVPFEITSLNATSKDFEKFISHFDYEYSENQKKKKHEKYVKNY